MHDDHVLIEQRLQRTLGRLVPAVYSARSALDVAAWSAPGEPVAVGEGLRAPYAPVRAGDRWGPPWNTTWFRLSGHAPAEWAGRTVEALIDIGFDADRTGFQAEGLVYRADGSPVKGLNPHTQWVRVPADEPVELYVEAAANPLILADGHFRPTPLDDRATAGDEPLYRLERAELAVFEAEVWELVADLEVLGQLAAELDLGDPRRWQILRAVDRGLDAVDLQDIAATATAGREALAGVLAVPARASAHRVSAVGHAHIDSAWLWPVRETVRKVARTTANVTDLMDAHPELVYAMSSAQQFAWLQEHRPEVFARVADRVKAGQFVPVGGMWVESDTNMPGGEALARQFSVGKRYFADEFGVETEEVWLPDSFGYTAALPQLIALSGSRWFLSRKISWNQTNKFPHHTFWWEGLDGTPRVVIERPADFFARAQAEYPDAPVWSGELYLEFHRGTYTSQAKTKQGNRRCEHLLREAELWCATAAIRRGTEYPYEALDRLWKVVLLQQFHDILPGSSIHWVHREAAANYAAVAAELEQLVTAALRVLAGDGATDLVFNAAPHARNGVPALGAAPRSSAAPVSVTPDGGGYVLDNGVLRVAIDAGGLVTSVRDGEREVLAPGSVANLLQLHPDTPNFYDAWDIDAFYRNMSTDLVDGAILSTVDRGVRVVRSFGNSTVTQTITLDGGRVDFDTDVDWHETEKLLKVAFDLDVMADRSASEIQFGHVMRPTHTNTSWDAAKFEICAHRWIHVGEPGYGVAVVNDSTYGHDVTRRARRGGGISTQVRLSLLRAPRFPDPDTDQGRHRLRYALVPGAGIVDAAREGYRINLPERTTAGTGPVAPLVTVDNDGVIVESVKLADDRSGDLIVRLYEARGARTQTAVQAGFAATAVTIVDLLERELDRADLIDDRVAVDLRPFQILTLRIHRA